MEENEKDHSCSNKWCKGYCAWKIDMGTNFIVLNVGPRNMKLIPWEMESLKITE